MPIDDLTALGQKNAGSPKEKRLTQQELADLSQCNLSKANRKK